jgi:DNA-binding CsgD family transcriptional regulator
MFDMQSFPSFLYKERVDLICQHIEERMHIKYFIFYISSNNGKTFVLSNSPHDMLKVYYGEHFYKQDCSYVPEMIDDIDYYLCDDGIPSDSKDFKNMLEERFSMYRSYYTIKHYPECKFIFGAVRGERCIDYLRHYKKTIHDFDEFCCFFVDGVLDIVKSANILNSDSRIFKDKAYRNNIIKKKFYEERLTRKEKECIYLMAEGKTSSEIAEILNNKIATIHTHKKNIMRKMNANHMVQATIEALKRGEIKIFNNVCGKQRPLVLNGVLVRT